LGQKRKPRLTALKNQRAEVKLLLEAARRYEAQGPDAKAEALLDWNCRLQGLPGHFDRFGQRAETPKSTARALPSLPLALLSTPGCRHPQGKNHRADC